MINCFRRVVPYIFFASLNWRGSGIVVRISSEDEYASFATNLITFHSIYSEATVLLENDLSFSGSKNSYPLGKNESFPFNGFFDGQGYLINSLCIGTDDAYAGLIGYSEGAKVRNVILGEALTITTTAKENIYIGGILGYYNSKNNCSIENCIYSAQLSINNENSGPVFYVGGVLGCFIKSDDSTYLSIKNCANYGTITFKNENAIIGGIIGFSNNSGVDRDKVTIKNCLHAGNLNANNLGSSSNPSNYLYLGGIIGYSNMVSLDNCVSLGFSSLGSLSFGGICGFMVNTSLSYCFWDEMRNYSMTINQSNIIKKSYDFSSTTLELSGAFETGNYAGRLLVPHLNQRADIFHSESYSHWFSNENSNEVSFGINEREKKISKLYRKVILGPEIYNGDPEWFDGWYTDNSFSELFKSDNLTKDITLHGHTRTYTATFIARGDVSFGSITAEYMKEIIILPDPDNERKGCYFKYWVDEKRNIYAPSSTYILERNVTFYAVYSCDNITTAEDLVDLTLLVSFGTNYSGTTVVIENDIDFSKSNKRFLPIGSDDHCFNGDFDGRGYVISNLNVSSSGGYVGLFGHYCGSNIRNVVLDNSCNITCSDNNTKVGGIVGYVDKANNVTMENCISSVEISSPGRANGVFIGGVVGASAESEYNLFTIKNCAYYGKITYSGIDRSSIIGGIISECKGNNAITNCLNAGNISVNENCYRIFVGGIIGKTSKIYSSGNIQPKKINNVINCVNIGYINVSKKDINYVGTIVGYTLDTNFSYCFWEESNELKFVGNNHESYSIEEIGSFNFTTLELNSSYKGDIVTSVLNNNSKAGYSHWFSNKNEKKVSFTINKRALPILETNSRIILAPEVVVSEKAELFNEWYTDSNYSTLCDQEITDDIEIHTFIKKTIISFYDNKNGTFMFNYSGLFMDEIDIVEVAHKEGFYPKECFVENKKLDNMFAYAVPINDVNITVIFYITNIKTVDDFLEFVNETKYGNHSGITVILENDLVFNESNRTISPIGSNSCFNGDFDGRGHVISNLSIISSDGYVGLFGRYCGSSIKNVVLDSSCSITYERPIFCQPNPCSTVIYVGGLVGEAEAAVEIVNCANYGTISISGINSESYVGGIIGHASSNISIMHSLFSGRIDVQLEESGSSSSAGENSCSQSDLTIGGFIGGFIGSTEDSKNLVINLTNCFNSGNVSVDDQNCSIGIFFGGDSSIPESCVLSGCSSGFVDPQTGKNTTFLRDLKDKSARNWTILHLDDPRVDVSCNFMVANFNSLPTLENDKYEFDSWCVDSNCTEVYNDADYRCELWASWKSQKLTLAYKNGTNETILLAKGSYIKPQYHLENYTGVYWCNESKTHFTGCKVTEDLTLFMMDDKVGNESIKRITTSAEFMKFNESVPRMNGYLDMTVYLENDINMVAYKNFTPIKDFAGTFDGRGHRIRNLHIESSGSSVGLFESLSDSAVVKNLVLDSSCKILYKAPPRQSRDEPDDSKRDVYIGGISGFYSSRGLGESEISNVISKAEIRILDANDNVAFHVGGIIGSCKGCVIEGVSNYGTINGSAIKGGCVGGIVGNSTNSTFNGVESHGGISADNANITGGVVGNATNISLRRVVKTSKVDNYTIIEAKDNASTSEYYCWNNSEDSGFICAYNESSTDNLKTNLTDLAGVVKLLKEKDNGTWVFNENENVTFYIDDEVFVTVDAKFFKLPEPVNSADMEFHGWYNDKYFVVKFDNDTLEEGLCKLYGRWNNYTSPNYTIRIQFELNNISETHVESTIIEIIEKETFRIVKFEEGNENEINELHYIIKFMNTDDGKKIVEYANDIEKNSEINESIVKIEVYDERTGQPIRINSIPSDNTTPIIMIVVVACVVVVVLISMLAIFIVKYQQHKNKVWTERLLHSRIVSNFNFKSVTYCPDEGVFCDPHAIYPQDYRPPNDIKEALKNSGMEDELSDEVVGACQLNLKIINSHAVLSNGFNENDAMAVSMYTFDFGNANYDMNPYRLLNAALANQDVEDVKKVRDLLYIVMTSLRRLPVVRGVTLYRGIRSSVDMSVHQVGSVISWPAFSSTTPDMKVTENFLTKQMVTSEEGIDLSNFNEISEELHGTLFIIEDAWGYDIQPYSFYRDEEEILLEPEQQFKVESVIDGGEFTLITLRSIRSIQILPERFGRIQEI